MFYSTKAFNTFNTLIWIAILMLLIVAVVSIVSQNGSIDLLGVTINKHCVSSVCAW